MINGGDQSNHIRIGDKFTTKRQSNCELGSAVMCCGESHTKKFSEGRCRRTEQIDAIGFEYSFWYLIRREQRTDLDIIRWWDGYYDKIWSYGLYKKMDMMGRFDGLSKAWIYGGGILVDTRRPLIISLLGVMNECIWTRFYNESSLPLSDVRNCGV